MTLPSSSVFAPPQLDGLAGNQVNSGNLVTVSLAGLNVGLIQSMRASDDYGVEPCLTLGHIEAQELIPLTARHQLTISLMSLTMESLYFAGASPGAPYIIPQSGENSDPTTVTALDGYQFTIEVFDRASGAGLVKYTGCVYASGDVDFTVNRIVVTNAVFMAAHREGLLTKSNAG